MSAATKTWIWRMERSQYGNPMTVQLFQTPFVELHATRAGAEPNAELAFQMAQHYVFPPLGSAK